MKQHTAIDTRKKAGQPTVSNRLQHTSVYLVSEHELLSNAYNSSTSRDPSRHYALANSNFGHDFSRIQVHFDAKNNQPVADSCSLGLTTLRTYPFGTACHTCPPRVQAKLKIGQPNDKYEQEADRVAEQVMRMSELEVQRKACSSCNENDEEELIQAKPLTTQITPLVQRQVGEEVLQTKEVSEQIPGVTQDVQMKLNNLRGSGKPLPESERSFFEPRFGYDFSQVRVHTDARAAESARLANAQAFTVGKDIVIGAGRDSPGTVEGQRLLAHELTHCIQQGAVAPLNGPRTIGARKQLNQVNIANTNEPNLQFKRVLVHASGFERDFPFQSDADELRCGHAAWIGGDPDCEWSPSSIDFEAAGLLAGGSLPAATIQELLDIIASQPKWSIDELGIIGHANNDAFGLGGTITADNVYFSEPSMIAPSATFMMAVPQIIQLRDRFARDAKITLFGCGAGGVNTNLVELVSRSFMRCVLGFSDYIQTELRGQGPKRQVTNPQNNQQTALFIGNNWNVVRRGRVIFNKAILMFEKFIGPEGVPAVAWKNSVFELQPDRLSCFGATKEMIKRSIEEAREEEREIQGTRFVWWFSPADRAVRAVKNILDRHFTLEESEKVGMVNYDELIAGVRVEPAGQGPAMKGNLTIGAKFLQRIASASPETLASIGTPVKEIERALRLIDSWRAGQAEPRTTYLFTLP